MRPLNLLNLNQIFSPKGFVLPADGEGEGDARGDPKGVPEGGGERRR